MEGGCGGRSRCREIKEGGREGGRVWGGSFGARGRRGVKEIVWVGGCGWGGCGGAVLASFLMKGPES